MSQGNESAGTADAVRIILGVGVVAIAGAAILYAVKSSPSPRAPDSDPSPSVMISAARQGVDLTNGTPQQDRDRLVGLFESGQTTPFAQTLFRSGLYLVGDTEQVFSGYLSATHEDGSPRLVCCVVDGRLQGPSIELHPGGGVRRGMTHKDGRLVGQIIEFYSDGSLKLRAMAREDSERGGNVVSELLVGEVEGGSYSRKKLGKGRIQLLFEDGTVPSSNEEMPLHEAAGWMLFYDSVLTGQKPYTTDSRRMGLTD
ncbi:MAG: hypothetical protein AAGA55_01265 [Planctomycetota bacterium]